MARISGLKAFEGMVGDMGNIQQALFAKDKGMSRALAWINTLVAVTKAYTGAIWPFNLVAGAGALAAGLAQVRRIEATSYATGGEVSSPTLSIIGDAGPEILAPKQDFIDVTNDLIRRGVIGETRGGTGALELEMRRTRQAVENIRIVQKIDGADLAVIIDNGQLENQMNEF